MSNQLGLFHRTVNTLGEAGVLDDLILIGSWCLYFYRIFFNDSDNIPLIRTVDLDFLLRNPPKISSNADVSSLLNQLGFTEEYSLMGGFSKFIHPDLEVEFLIPEKGRGKDGPHRIEKININAQGLRYIGILQDHTMKVPFGQFSVTIPEPSAFVIHKFHLSTKRFDDAKKIKDIETAVELGEFIISITEHKVKMRTILEGLPAKWVKDIKSVIENNSSKIYHSMYGE